MIREITLTLILMFPKKPPKKQGKERHNLHSNNAPPHPTGSMITRCPLIYSHVSPIVMPCLSPPAYLAKISCCNKRDFVSEGCFLMTTNFACTLDSSPGFSFQMLIQPNTDQIQNTSKPHSQCEKDSPQISAAQTSPHYRTSPNHFHVYPCESSLHRLCKTDPEASVPGVKLGMRN